MARRGLCAVIGAVAIGGSLSLFAGEPANMALNAGSAQSLKLADATAGVKPKLSIKKGDYELTFKGGLKIENYFEDNAYMLNNNIPDENEYFKETLDLDLDFEYGEEKFGYDAVEVYVGLRHKGVWGLPLSYADKDSGSTFGAQVKLDEALFSNHQHYTGKSLLWLREGWIKVVLNAAFNGKRKDHLQTLELGWFPFQLGRGIALGSGYGFNKEFLGLYSYTGEDKSAPGVDLFGEIIKDTLWYDLYYAKFEERGKSLSNVIEPVKASWQGRKLTPWRGTDKNDELIAARFKWSAASNETVGKIDVEPYVMCNFASDQWIELNPDTVTTLGAYGLGFEHSLNDFEWGGEVAFNFGSERLKAIDRNVAKIATDDAGVFYEYYSKLDYTNEPAKGAPVRVNTDSKNAASVDFGPGSGGNANDKPIPGYPQFTNKSDRFREAYKNDFAGWMSVLDAAYNLRKWDLKVAVSWSYASGDVDPHVEESNKRYHGFVGLHEGYFGKRVPSVFIMDQRLLKRPLALAYDPAKHGEKLTNVETDITFTDIQMYGIGATWSPSYSQNRRISFNPNVIGFWTTKKSHSVDYNGTTAVVSPDFARSYMGTELNLVVKTEILKDLTLFGKFAAFVPGGYFDDIKGIPLNSDFFSKLAQVVQNAYNPKDYRLGNDTAFHMNIGLEFKF